MGQKSKATLYGLKELIAEKWDGGKKTIVYVTEEVNQWLLQNGYKITVSREAIRRAVRSYEDKIADLRKANEQARHMAEVLKDQSGIELSEGMLMCIVQLLFNNLSTIESINIEDPVKMIDGVAKAAMAHAKVNHQRTQAVKALDRAKTQLKAELQKAIQHDPDLLGRLCTIVDDAKVK